MRIVTIPLNSDNYGYLIIDEETKDCAIVDVSNQPEQVANVIENEGPLNLSTILTTHKHWDHAHGNGIMKEKFPEIKIYGSSIDKVEACTDIVEDGDEFTLGPNIKIKCLHTPGHTMGHICYYVSHEGLSQSAVFTGDTLFVGGVGKFVEGSGKDMFPSLYDKLGSLPTDTLVYCGHEYTLSNYKFCLSIEPENTDLFSENERAKALRADNKPTVPSTIGRELQTNVFMRVNQPTIQKVFHGLSEPAAILDAVRDAKNNF